MANPPNTPRATAKIAFPMAKGHPSAPAVINNVGGSISGDDNQNAITAESGAPSARRPAIKGITSHEQNGAKPPKNAARKIMRTS